MNIVEFNQVCKSYPQGEQKREVLNQINLTIQQGEFIWLRGVNGAGKTTLVKLILGLENADSGTIRVFDHTPDRPEPKAKIGLMLQKTRAPEFLKVRELLNLIRSFYPNPYSLQELLKRSRLEHKQDSWANSDALSGGEERSLYFALAIAGDPDLLILDEPTTGLSGEVRTETLRQICEFASAGKTILLISHVESDIDTVRDLITRTITLNHGQIQETCAKTSAHLPSSRTANPKSQTAQAASSLSMLYGQTKVELLKLVRQPVFLLSMLLLYGIFGFIPAGTADIAAYMTGLAAINLFLVAVEKFSTQVAAERKQGWLKLLRVTPLPAWMYLAAKVIVATLLSIAGVALTFAFGAIKFEINLSLSNWIVLFLSLILGIIPFAITGFAIAYLIDAASISLVTTLLLGFALFTSGSIPLPNMPEWLRNLIPFSPFYHYAQLVMWAGHIKTPLSGQIALNLEWLAWATCAGGLLAVWAYRRDQVIG
jgi:ABC-2 type transport system ATP-binding protein